MLSYACGMDFKAFAEQFGGEEKLVRIIPNILNQSGNKTSVVCMNENITEEDTVASMETAVGKCPTLIK